MKNLRLCRLRVVFAFAIVCATALGATARPAGAGLLDPLAPVLQIVIPPCGAPVQPFTQWGDDHSYYAIPNNGFETGSAGWTLSGGARVVPGNEPYNLSGPGSYSLALPSGSSAVGPPTCVNLLAPYLRMIALDAGGADNGLQVQVRFYGLTGNLTGLLNFATFDPADHATWQPTGAAPSALALPLATRYMRIRLAPSGWGSNWRVDDVFVDPWLAVGD